MEALRFLRDLVDCLLEDALPAPAVLALARVGLCGLTFEASNVIPAVLDNALAEVAISLEAISAPDGLILTTLT